MSEEAVLQGWRFPTKNLWRIPLQENITSTNEHTLLLDGPYGFESLNSMYVVSLSAKILEHVKLFNNYTAHPKATNKINNMYELPSIEQAVRYLHCAAGSLT